MFLNEVGLDTIMIIILCVGEFARECDATVSRFHYAVKRLLLFCANRIRRCPFSTFRNAYRGGDASMPVSRLHLVR